MITSLQLLKCLAGGHFELGGVAQNLSGNHTHSGPVFEQGHLKLYPDMSH